MKDAIRIAFFAVAMTLMVGGFILLLHGQAAPAQANEQPTLTDDEKKDLVILNQALLIQQQRYQLLQQQIQATQQEFARLTDQRERRLAKARADHKWGEAVRCDPEQLTCALAPAAPAPEAQEGKSKK